MYEFVAVPHPGPNRITIANCCDDHDAWIAWCGCNNADDFLEALRQGGFDPFEFGSLYPEAYHYFSSAVVLFCLEKLAQEEAVSVGKWSYWISIFCPLRENSQDFVRRYVSQFSHEQREIIAEMLEIAACRYFSEEEMHYEDAEWAAQYIWRTPQ